MSATTSSDLLTQRFRSLARDNRRALVAYVTAGHPDPSRSVALMRAIADAGADVLEVWVPFSDPMADGPVISDLRGPGHGVGLLKPWT
jgi:tryptophan synthase alpha chain